MAFLDHPVETRCSNENCVKHTEGGGKFRLVHGKWYCSDCAGNDTVLNPGRNLWDFTTTHFNGEPIHVTSLGHLRRLEKQYGCSNFAANNDSRNWQ